MANKPLMVSFVSKESSMKLLVMCMVFFSVVLHSAAQQVRFIYLQSDNKQPFYVRLNEKIFSSSSTGYLVIPKLSQGDHKLMIGFPKNEWPLQTLNVNISTRDLGFSLKNFDNKGWGLFNLQTLEVINSNATAAGDVAKTSETRTDNFTEVLSNVVNTPSLRDQKKSDLPSVPIKEIEDTPSLTSVPVAEITAPEASIRKISSLTDADGMVVIYRVEASDGIDTISIMIPVVGTGEIMKVVEEAIPVQNPSQPKSKEEQPAADSTIQSNEDPKFLSIEIASPHANGGQPNSDGSTKAVTNQEVTKEGVVPLKMINSDCKSLANEQDFLKIRKKMTSEKTDANMISAAAKMFRQKCYSTEQVRNLSVLFLNDEEKYRFFDTVYPHVHDSPNFKTLESQLTDQYIITRFRAMLRN